MRPRLYRNRFRRAILADSGVPSVEEPEDRHGRADDPDGLHHQEPARWHRSLSWGPSRQTPRARCEPPKNRAFFEWGQYIQQADALADLDKDTQEGLVCSVPGHLAYHRDPETFLAAALRRDSGALYARSETDLTCLPGVDQRRRLLAPLAELGQVGPLLEWIHGLLLWRYLQHPACRRLASHPQVRPLLHDQPGWANFVGESTEGETSCSEH